MEQRLQKSFNPDKDFLNLFHHEIDGLQLTGKTKIDLFILEVDSCDFNYDSLIEELGNATAYYAISRSRIKELKKRRNSEHSMIMESVTKLRNWEVNDGEGGELLLYCFLKSHFNAPKILTKLELKTANNDYVKGSDGVHLLQKKGRHHLIFGESKLISNLRDGLYRAFSSIKAFKENQRNFELALVDSNLLKESFDDNNLYEFLKKVIKPSPSSDIKRSTAFGVLVGFDINVDDINISEVEDDEFSLLIRRKVKSELEGRYKYIKEKIEEYSLDGHHFYIYAIPFIKRTNKKTDEPITGINLASKKIIKRIKMQ